MLVSRYQNVLYIGRYVVTLFLGNTTRMHVPCQYPTKTRVLVAKLTCALVDFKLPSILKSWI